MRATARPSRQERPGRPLPPPGADRARSRGQRADSVRQFQVDQCLDVDSDVGPKRRSNSHKALVALTPARLEGLRSRRYRLPRYARSCDATQSRYTWWKSKEVSVPVISGGGASVLTAIGGILWQNLLIS